MTFLGIPLAGLAWLTGGRIDCLDGTLEACGGAVTGLLRRAGIDAITMGHVIIGATARDLVACRAHERIHVRQCEHWGPLFLPAYGASSLWAWVRGRHPYHDNRFEKEAVGR